MRVPPWLAAALVIGTGVIAYSNAFEGPLVFDDLPSLARNETIRSIGLDTLTPPAHTTLAERPFVNLTFALNYAWSGLRLGPLHATNLAIHLLAALVLMALIRRTLTLPVFGSRYADSAPALALLATLLWVCHPLQTESVTYVVQRSESLEGLLFLLTLDASLRAAQATRPFGWQATALLACGLGMVTKENMCVAPLMVVLFDRAFLFATLREAARARGLFYLALGLTLLVLGLQVITSPIAGSVGFHFADLGPADYLRIEVVAILRYVRLVFWPAGLVFDYGPAGDGGVPIPPVSEWAPAAAVLLTAGVATLRGWRRHRALGFAGTAFFVLLAPTSSFVPIKTEPLAEQRMYLASALLLLGAVLAARELAGQLAGSFPVLGSRRVWAAAGGACTLALARLTVVRNEDYRTAIGLWNDTLAKRPGNARAWTALGWLYRDAGQLAPADRAFAEALRLDPTFLQALEGAGKDERDAGNLTAAVAHFETYLRLHPAGEGVRLALAHCLADLGRLPEAEDAFRAVVALRPEDAQTREDLATLLARTGHLDEAIEHFRAAVRLEATRTTAWRRLGLLEVRTGQPEAGLRDLDEALRGDPDDRSVLENLGWLLATLPDSKLRDGSRALELASRRSRLTPATWRSLDVLAVAEAEVGDFAAAQHAESQALQAQPSARAEAELRARLELFERGEPYRTPPLQ